MTRIVVIGGSNRREAQSHRIAEIAAAKLAAREGVEAELFSLRDIDIPLWDEEKWAAEKPEGGFWAQEWPALSARLKAADGFVVISPEWHGMASPHLKNLFCCCDGRELAFKPAYLVSVSGSVGGAYPIAELRLSSYKNTYLHYLPDHLIIRNVGEYQPGSAENKAPEWLDARFEHGLDILIATAEAMRPVRETVVDLDRLKTGM